MIFLDEFGFTGQEATDMHFLARDVVRTQKSILSRQILEDASHETTVRIARAYRAGWLRGFSKVGQYRTILQVRDNPNDIDPLSWIVTDFLVDPLAYRNVAAWCLHHALQDSSTAFQFDSCPQKKLPSLEGRTSSRIAWTCRAISSRQCTTLHSDRPRRRPRKRSE